MAAAPSLEELLRGVTPEKLDQPCRDDHLSEIALSLTGWQSIAPFLGLSEVDEEAILCRYPHDLEMQSIAMLRKWKNKFGQSATYCKLVQVFFSRGKCDTVDKLCRILLQENVVSTSQLPANSYADYLRGRYRTQIPTFLTLQWPPPPTRRVFNLAMIRGQNIRYGPVDEDVVRLMLRGRVNDVVKQKKSVKLEDIFRLDSAERKVILIEGAPGSGKSTLAWHVCQKWASGELFREFKAVVFVQLRDPAVQSARSVEDILPAESRGQAAGVVAEFQACRGQGVLWVMDGWDELPSCLHTNSIFHRLIVSPETHNLHFSAVVITSRPIASGDLHHVVSSRVEILGFIPTEVKGYFTEAVGGDSQTVQKLQDQLRERPVIEASCYVPLNAAIVTHLFLAQNQSLPTTLHGVFTSLVLCCLIRHATKEGKTFGDISSLDNLPPYFQEPLEKICALAYHGVMKNKVTFSAEELKPLRLSRELVTLGLIQGVESLASFKKSVSFNFLHLSVQELLAAFYISKLPPSEQVKVFNTMFGRPRFAAVFQFYAAFTKLETEGIRRIIAKIATNVAHSLQHSKKMQLLYLLRGLYEAQDLSLCQFVGIQLGGALHLGGTPLSPVDCLSAGYFISCVCLTTSGEFRLDLIICSLDDYRVSLLVKELSKCCSTVTEAGVPGCVNLHLGNNEIRGSGIRCIAELISHSTFIRKLFLHHNSIRYGEDAIYGLRHLSQALMTNTSLVELDVSMVGITAEGVEVLAKALVVNEHLETLTIGEDGLSLDPLYRILSGRTKPLFVLDIVSHIAFKHRSLLPPTTPSPPPAFASQGHCSRRHFCSSPPGVLRVTLASPGAVPSPRSPYSGSPPPPGARTPWSPHPDPAAREGSRWAEIPLRFPAVRRPERKVPTKRVPASPPLLPLPPSPSPLPPRPEARQAPLPHPLPPSEVSRSPEGTLPLDGERQRLSPLPRGPLRLQEAREEATRYVGLP